MRAVLIVLMTAAGVAACAEGSRDDVYGVTYVEIAAAEAAVQP
ncbi:MAG: hypothetical protein AAF221_15825 [Pseudomonadota bacterium]